MTRPFFRPYQRNYPRDLYLLKDGNNIAYRLFSLSGPPTIDIKTPEMKKYIKLKFLEKN